MHKRSVVIIFMWTLLTLVPFITTDLFSRHTDLDGDITPLIFITQSLKSGFFPQWNPFINQGLPIIADPLSSHLHPLVLPALLFLQTQAAIIFLICSSVFMGGIGMYYVLSILRIDPRLSRLLALTYISSGYLVSRLSAGHFEKVLSFALLPYFCAGIYLIYKRNTLVYEVLTSIIMALILFSGDLYNTLYCVIIVMALGIFSGSLKKFISYSRTFSFFLLLASIKILPLMELSDYIGKVREPLEGSQNFISFLYYFFIPMKGLFIFTGLGEHLQTGFAWWEKVAFVGPTILIGFGYYIYRIFHARSFRKPYIFVFTIALLVLIVLSMPASSLNPYRYLIEHFPSLQLFHVPSRTFGLLTCILLISSAFGLQALYLKYPRMRVMLMAIVSLNLLITLAFFYFVALRMQRPIREDRKSIARLIDSIPDQSPYPYYIGQFLEERPVMQHEIVGEHKVLNSNYGLMLGGSPSQQFTRYDFKTTKDYTDIIPKYFIAGETIRLPSRISATAVECEQSTCLYESNSFTPYASTSPDEVFTAAFIQNQIIVSGNATRSADLVLLESYYPGWSASIDGKPADLVADRFLKVRSQPGFHIYTFSYHSNVFMTGFLVSGIAWISCLLYLWKRQERIYRNH